jgi:hypothetical protein
MEGTLRIRKTLPRGASQLKSNRFPPLGQSNHLGFSATGFAPLLGFLSHTFAETLREANAAVLLVRDTLR